jgi:hypothetical protein
LPLPWPHPFTACAGR